MIKFIRQKEGVATIPIILVLTILVIAVGLAISTVAFNETTITQDFSRSSQALIYAEAGVHDALIKTTRDGRYTPLSNPYTIEFVSGGCATPYNGCATVTVTSDQETLPNSDIDTFAPIVPNIDIIVVSKGQVKNNIKKVRVKIKLDSNWLITDTISSEVTD